MLGIFIIILCGDTGELIDIVMLPTMVLRFYKSHTGSTRAKLVVPRAKLVVPRAKLVVPRAKLVVPRAKLVVARPQYVNGTDCVVYIVYTHMYN